MAVFPNVLSNTKVVVTGVSPVAGNILVDTGTTFPAGGDVKSTFASVAPGTIPGIAQDKGNAVLVAGTVTVADTAVTSTSTMIFSRKVVGGTLGNLSYTVSAGVGFTITSTSNTDTSTISYVRFG